MSENALHYAELNRHIQKYDYEKVIKAANKALHIRHDDIKAFQCKIVALINLDRFEDALTAFNKFPEFTKELLYEKAYTLYRLNKVEEALKTIDSSPDKTQLHFQELKAQIYYRQERFEESYVIYRDLIKQTADEYDDERKTNFTANVANLATQGQNIYIVNMSSFRATEEDPSHESYEILFNAGCYLLYRRKFQDAELYLLDAEKYCLESFDEDTPQDEIDNEVNVIRTQLACCKHFQKKENQAMNIYKAVLDKKPTDYGVIAVTNNNILALNKNRNVFELKKKMKALQSDVLMSKLTALQKKAVVNNLNQINALNAQTNEEALKICDKIINECPCQDNLEGGVLLKAAILMKNKNLTDAIDAIEDHIKNSSSKSMLKMGLAMTQLYLNMGKYEKAVETLKSLGEEMFYPGVVSALVTIMIALGNTAGASEVLQSAVDWNKKNQGHSGELTALWQHAADLHLKRRQYKLAIHSLEELLKINPEDLKVLSKLTIAYAKTNVPGVRSICSKIRQSINLQPKFDISYFETSSWMMGLKAIRKVAKDQSPGTPFTQKNKKTHNSKKRIRLPKNYDPLVTPDPERWLPKRERSTFKKKKDRRNKDGIGKGSQGSTGVSSDYDMSSRSSNRPTSASSAGSSVEEYKPPRKVQRKKKKAGKW